MRASWKCVLGIGKNYTEGYGKMYINDNERGDGVVKQTQVCKIYR
jgi:hypothetical protein